MLRGNQPRLCLARTPWNKGRLIGQKRPLKPKDVWAIRVRLQLEQRKRDLALFNLGIDRSFTVGGHRWCEPPKRIPPPGGDATGRATVPASVGGTNCRGKKGGPIWLPKRPARDSMRACNPLPANANDRGAARSTAVGGRPAGAKAGVTELRMAVGTEAAALCMFIRGVIAAEMADPRNTWIGPRETKAPEGRLSREGSRCQVLVAVPGM